MVFSFGASRSTRHTGADQGKLISLLKDFEPFQRISDEDIVMLATRCQLESTVKGDRLFDIGDDDPWMFCLLEGSLNLVAGDGRELVIDGGTRQARKPVAQLKPRIYSAVTTTPARFLRIDCSGFSTITPPADAEDYCVSELQADALESSGDPHRLSLIADRLSLPALPDVALETCRLVDDPNSDTAKISAVVARDPVISAKLMKAANSPVFYGSTGIERLDRAVARLGLRTTRQLVLSFAVQDLFKSDSATLNKRMHRLWDHSVEVSALSFLLARELGGFAPEEAQLAGLIHDVPEIPIIGYAKSQPDLAERPQALDALVKRLRHEIGHRLLSSWNFPQAILTAVVDAETWWRDPAPEADLADLVIVAQLVSFLGKSEPPDVPSLARLPAFRKISRDRLDPAAVIEMIHKAEGQLAELRALFGAGRAGQ